jgi:hypothetical protein
MKVKFFRQQRKLLSEDALKAMEKNKERKLAKIEAAEKVAAKPGSSAATAEGVPVPALSYQIEEMVMFKFEDKHLMLIRFENKTVQCYEYETGKFYQNFVFEDNILHQLREKNLQKQRELDDKADIERERRDLAMKGESSSH